MKVIKTKQNHVNLDKLRGILAEKKISSAQCAKALGISQSQFYRKMDGQVIFWITEVTELVKLIRPTQKEFNEIFLKGIDLE